MKLNLKVVSVLGIAAVVAVGGTFAYYTATDTFKNPFNTESFGTSSVEVFNPADGDNWEPGVKVDKAVFGMNEGDGDVYVRVFFEEEWSRDGVTLTTLTSESDDFAPEKSIQPGNGGKDDTTGLTDGKIVNGGESVVFKTLENVVGESERSTPEKWYKGSDGWYYYTSVLTKGKTTKTLLNGVQLAGDTDMGLYLDFAGFRKIQIVGKDDPDIVAGYKPELEIIEGKLKPKDPSVVWYDMKKEGEYYRIPTIIQTADDGTTTEVPVDNDGKPIEYNSKDETFFSYEEHKLDSAHKGYADANYNLKIKVEYIQADKDHAAVDASGWKWYPGKED